MNKLKLFFKTIYFRIVTTFIVRKYDSKSPIYLNECISDDLVNYGYLSTNSNELFGFSISDLCEKYNLSDFQFNKDGLYFTRNIPDEIISRIISSEKLKNIVFNYLGSNARIDDFYIKNQAPNSNSISEGWHTDNVGYRLKMFISYKADINSPKTIVMSNTHKKLFKFPLYETLVRLSSFYNINVFNIFKDKFKEDHSNIISLSYFNDCINMFDTNANHRGDYAEYTSPRNCIVFEFIDGNKSNKLSKYAPCGPGQSPNKEINFSFSLEEELFKSDLIDKNILKLKKQYNKDYFSYSISNKKN